MQSKRSNTQAFFELIRAGLWEAEVRLLAFDSIDYPQVLSLAATCQQITHQTPLQFGMLKKKLNQKLGKYTGMRHGYVAQRQRVWTAPITKIW